jgi:hypothetical protein
VLPKSGFLPRYVQWGTEWIVANPAFHLVCGLALLSQTLPLNYGFPDSPPKRANFYGLCVGPSSRAGKSRAILAAQETLDLTLPNVTMIRPGSPQAFVEDLSGSNQILFYDEFGEFLQSTQQGQLAQLRSSIMQAYDCAKMSRSLMSDKRQGKASKQVKPRLSILGGVAPDLLESFSTLIDWRGGFFARFFTVNSSREERLPRPFDKPRTIEQQALAEILKAYAQERPLDPGNYVPNATPHCLGRTEEAEEFWQTWTKALEKRSENAPGAVIAGVNRAIDYAIKIALLLAWDSGEGRSLGEWRISLDTTRSAIAITDLHIESVIEVAENIAPTQEGQRIRSLYNALSETEPRTLGQALLRMGFAMNKQQARYALDTLLEMGLVQIPEVDGFVSRDAMGRETYTRVKTKGAPGAREAPATAAKLLALPTLEEGVPSLGPAINPFASES